MCCLFGLLDYGRSLTAAQKNHILSVLSTACEVRGTDATGIAYNTDSGLQIYKRPLPAHHLHLHIPKDTKFVMGHTRMTTQGCEKHNHNNHPFSGCAGGVPFALAHNGVLHNDHGLRRQRKLPSTKIETDSYVAVQLIERSGELSFASLKQMAEAVEGTFTFTVTDNTDNLYIVKGNNPICLYHWPKLGLYIYASTEDILKRTLQGIRLKLGKPQEVSIESGEIVRVDRFGRIARSRFDTSHLFHSHSYFGWPYQFPLWGSEPVCDSYVSELKSVARAFGYAPEDIDGLLNEGFTPEEIEETFYSMEV